MCKYKYYNYVMAVQTIVMIVLAFWIMHFTFFSIYVHYSDQTEALMLAIISLIDAVLLIVSRVRMDNIKKDSWKMYNIMIAATMIIAYAVIRMLIPDKESFSSISFEIVKSAFNEIAKYHSCSALKLRYVGMLFFVGLMILTMIYSLVSIIGNTLSFSKREEFFAN